MMPASELIKILRVGAQGLDVSVRFLILDVCDRLERQTRDNELLMQKIVELRSRGKWIPVCERLPEEKGLYLVAVINDHERRYSKTAWYHGHGNWFLHQKVTHWMPLPEAPKGE